MLKRKKQNRNRRWRLIVLCALLLSGCGYSFPYVYEGKEQVVYMPTWKNQTNKLGLDMKIYQSLSRWFQKSEKIDLTKEKSGADLILTGEILSISLPSVSWNTVTDATGTEISLSIHYVLRDLRTGTVLWKVNKAYTADYSVISATIAADNEALAKIIDDLSEDIYLGTLNAIKKQHQQAQATP